MLAAVAAIGFGIGDFLGGVATRAMPAMRTLLWAHGIGLALTVGWVLFSSLWSATGGDPITSDVVRGVLAGAFGLGGLLFLYTGLARGRAAVVAPAAAVVGALVPVAAAIVAGDRPGPAAWIGVMAAVPAILLVSAVAGTTRRTGGLSFGLAAGTFFGGYFVVLADTSDASGLWPLVASRGVSTLALVTIGVIGARSWLVRPTGAIGSAVLGVGVLDLVGNIAFLLAARAGSLVVVAVVASMFPAVTVVASRFVYDERLSARQILGLLLGVSAVALLSIG